MILDGIDAEGKRCKLLSFTPVRAASASCGNGRCHHGGHSDPAAAGCARRHAGLFNSTPHGLRKAGAAFCAEAGMSHADLMAFFGWETMAQPDVYIRKFRRQRAAMRAMPLFNIPRRPSPTFPKSLSPSKKETFSVQ
jgi:hypothetical protein